MTDARGEVVIAVYRWKPGRRDALLAIVEKHVPTLRTLGLITDRPVLLVEGKDAFLEIFEWTSNEAAVEAHHAPDVAELWNAMEEVATFPALAEIEDAQRRFPHFRPVEVGRG
jgi:hypothetical protein